MENIPIWAQLTVCIAALSLFAGLMLILLCRESNLVRIAPVTYGLIPILGTNLISLWVNLGIILWVYCPQAVLLPLH